MEEIFEPLKINELYEISKLGNVRNAKTKRILKPRKSFEHCGVVLYDNDSKSTAYRMHRLVALQWIDNPQNKPFVDHIDNDKHNNKLENLRWATNSENQQNQIKRKNSTSEKHMGLCKLKNRNLWKVGLKLNGKQINLGYAKTEEEGATRWNDYIIANKLTEFYKLNVV